VGEAYRVPVREADRIRADLALALAAATTGVSMRRMAEPGRLKGPESRARRLALYVAHITYGWPLERVGHAFGLNRATAAAACRWTEDARDHRAVDELLESLERTARAVTDLTPLELPA
jgi:hypothetical protein